jgi:DEAD/DEAH box helicase domain-containing protein
VEQGLNLKFCSKGCRAAWESGRDDGPERVHLRGRPNRRGGNWRLQADRARKRDGFCCQVCGITEEALGRRLDVHHRVPARTYRLASESNQLENLVTVCPSCHKRLEERGRQELPLFEDVRHPGQRTGPHRGA